MRADLTIGTFSKPFIAASLIFERMRGRRIFMLGRHTSTNNNRLGAVEVEQIGDADSQEFSFLRNQLNCHGIT